MKLQQLNLRGRPDAHKNKSSKTIALTIISYMWCRWEKWTHFCSDKSEANKTSPTILASAA